MDQNQFERLLAVGPALSPGLDLGDALRRIVDVAREVTGAGSAALGVLGGDRDAFENFVTSGWSEEAITGGADLSHGHGAAGEPILKPELLGVPILVRGEPYGTLYLTDKADGTFDVEDAEVLGRLAVWAGIAIENAGLYETVRERQRQLERTVEVLETNVEIARAIGSATELEPVLALVVARARALVEARAVVLALTQGDELVVTNIAGDLAAELVGQRIRLNRMPVGQRAKTARAGAVEMPSELVKLLERSADADGSLVVPMVFDGSPLGAIVAIDRTAGRSFFDAHDRRLLHAFAGSASIAVASAQRATQRVVRQSIEASERERERWARELHDATLQDIGALRLLLTTTRRGGAATTVEDTLDEAIARLGDMGGSLRALITDLRPPVLDHLGLEPALHGIADRVRRTSALEVDLYVDLTARAEGDPARLAPALELCIYRVVQESVTNVVKHSGAGQIAISVLRDAQGIELSVRDDGDGFNPSAMHDGFGLTGIRERVEQNGGRVEIVSEPGGGSVIQAELPVAQGA